MDYNNFEISLNNSDNIHQLIKNYKKITKILKYKIQCVQCGYKINLESMNDEINDILTKYYTLINKCNGNITNWKDNDFINDTHNFDMNCNNFAQKCEKYISNGCLILDNID